MFEFDGSYGEGGGDVIRFALSYSSITGLPVKINNIRSRRNNPGLQLHHLSTVKALGELCDAELIGAEKGSRQLTFVPRKEIVGGEYLFDIYDADLSSKSGTVAPVIKAVLIPLAFSHKESYIVFRGATESSFSVPLSRLQNVLLPTLSRMGIEAEIKIKSRSWYPLSGGEVEICVKGGNTINSVRGLNIATRGKLINLRIEIIWGGISALNIEQFVKAAIRKSGFAELGEPIKVNYTEIQKSLTQNVGVFLFVNYENSLVCFEKFDNVKNLELTIIRVFSDFSKFHSSIATIDKYLSDQLVLPCILASEDSSWIVSSITDHLLTNIWLCRNWIGRNIELNGKLNEVGVFKVHKP